MLDYTLCEYSNNHDGAVQALRINKDHETILAGFIIIKFTSDIDSLLFGSRSGIGRAASHTNPSR
jgi:hypothetical protein